MFKSLNHTFQNVLRRLNNRAPVSPLQREINQHNAAIDAKNARKLQAKADRKLQKK